jgi:uncharacterized membrane protein YkvI
VKGYLVRIGLYLVGLPSVLQEAFNLPEWLSFIITGAALIVVIITVTVCGILMYMSRVKED